MKNIFKRRQSASKDYLPSMLPQTRREVFLDVLKLNWKPFVLYGLLFLLFCLPLQIVTLSESMAAINLQTPNENLPQEQLPYLMSMTRILASLIKIPCLLLIAVAVSGFARVMRQYAWMENVNFTYEFSKGVKYNVGQLLLLAALAGLTNVAAVFFLSVADTATDFLSSIIVLIPAAAIFLCLGPVAAYMTVSISIYRGRLGTHFRVGRLLYAQAPWKTLLALLCCLAPFVLQLFPVFIVQLIGAVLSPILAPTVFLGWYLFALDGLDRHINPREYPALVGRGLYDPQSLEKG